MHVSPKDEKCPLWVNIRARTEPQDTIGERDLFRLTAIDSWPTKILWTLSFIKKDIAFHQAEPLKNGGRKIHLHDVTEVDSILEDVRYTQIGAHMGTCVPVGMPLSPEVYHTRISNSH